MSNLGAVNGYCLIFAEVTRDMAERGEAPWFHLFRAGSMQIGNEVKIDPHHCPRAAFATTRDGTLRAGVDDLGVWFKADLPPTATGFDVFNALRGGRSLSSSCSVADLVADWRGDVLDISRAALTAISIVEEGKFPSARCWLADEEPIDPVARSQQQRFVERAVALKQKPIFGAATLAQARGLEDVAIRANVARRY